MCRRKIPICPRWLISSSIGRHTVREPAFCCLLCVLKGHQGADNGRCEGIDFNASTRDGITMYVRLDARWVFPRWRDAHTNCKLGGEVYQVIKEERVVNVPTVQLNWWEGHIINLPPQNTLQGYTVTFKTFNALYRTSSG